MRGIDATALDTWIEGRYDPYFDGAEDETMATTPAIEDGRVYHLPARGLFLASAPDGDGDGWILYTFVETVCAASADYGVNEDGDIEFQGQPTGWAMDDLIPTAMTTDDWALDTYQTVSGDLRIYHKLDAGAPDLHTDEGGDWYYEPMFDAESGSVFSPGHPTAEAALVAAQAWEDNP